MTKIPFFVVHEGHDRVVYINLFQVVRFESPSSGDDVRVHLSDGKHYDIPRAIWQGLRQNNADYLSGLPRE